jgi:predicted Zn-dependent protease
MVSGKKLNTKELLSGVNRIKIENELRKSKDGLPQPFISTNEPVEEKNLAQMQRRDKEYLWEIYDNLKKSCHEYEYLLEELITLRKKYPNVPAIYNYMSLAYVYSNQEEEYYQTIIETYKKFPDYLFGKISVAEYYLKNNKYKKIPAIFNEKLEIYMHYPKEIKEFHVSEVRAFYSIIGRYHAKNNNISRAIFCYFITNQVDEKHWAAQELADEIVLAEIRNLQRKKLLSNQSVH